MSRSQWRLPSQSLHHRPTHPPNVSCTEPDWDDDADSGMEASTSSFAAEVSYLLLRRSFKTCAALCKCDRNCLFPVSY